MGNKWGQGKDAGSANKQCTNIDEQAESFHYVLSSLTNKAAFQTSGILSAHFDWACSFKTFCLLA